MASLQAAVAGACLDPSTDWLQGIIQDHERHVDSPINFEELMISCSTRSPLEIVVEGSGVAGADHQRSRTRPQPADQLALKCPRCDSTHTKFCYYNNYSLSQPRYFCKTCRRYWTKGGSLRNVPVGGGCRKNNKRTSVSSSSAAKKHIINIDPAVLLQPALNNLDQYPYKILPNFTTTHDHNPKNLNLSNFSAAGGHDQLLISGTHKNQLDSASSLFRNFNGFSLLGHEFSIGEVGGPSCYGSYNSIDPISGYPIDGLATRINLGFDQANCDDKGDDDHDQYDEVEMKPKITNLFDDSLSSVSSIKGDGDSIKRMNLTLEWEDKINGNGQDDHDQSTDHSSSGAHWRTLSSFANSYNGLYSL